MMTTVPPTDTAIRLIVEDLDASIAFYHQAVGLSSAGPALRRPDGGRFQVLAAGSTRLRLEESRGTARCSSVASITVEVDREEAVVASHILARMLGGDADSPVLVEGCWTALLRDPDGHSVRVVHSPRRTAPARGSAARTGRRTTSSWRGPAPSLRPMAPRSIAHAR